MKALVKNNIDKFILQVRELLGSSLSEIILYGSYARGDYNENSDIDLMLLVDMKENEIKQIVNSVYDLAFDFELGEGIHISIMIKNTKEYEYWAYTLPFYKNVKKEGVVIRAE